MGKDNKEGGGLPSRGKAKQRPKAVAKPIFTFRPTVEQAALMRAEPKPLERVLSDLGEKVEAGMRLTISQPLDRESFTVLLKEQCEDWQDGLGISAWHRDLEQALRGVHFYVTALNPDWPDTPAVSQVSFDEW